MHCLTDRQVLFDADIIGGDQTSDLILIIGIDQLDICPDLIVDHRTKLHLHALVNIFPQIYRIICVHLVDDLCQLVDSDLFNILSRIVNIRNDFRHPFCINRTVQKISFSSV